jgi:DNA oxidative demethylase
VKKSRGSQLDTLGIKLSNFLPLNDMLFKNLPVEVIPDFWLLPAFVETASLLVDIENIAEQSPFRYMQVARGSYMKVAMTNCGNFGWTSSTRGYRYDALDSQGPVPKAWPTMPSRFKEVASNTAKAVGWEDFQPDACLVNRYENAAGMGLHQDKDEKDLRQPIVSVSIGAACKFIIGGLTRQSPTRSITLNDGDVLIWGKSARLVFHGVRPLIKGLTRYNLTMRKAF